MVQISVTFRVSGEAGQRYKLGMLVGGEFYVERVLIRATKSNILNMKMFGLVGRHIYALQL